MQESQEVLMKEISEATKFMNESVPKYEEQPKPATVLELYGLVAAMRSKGYRAAFK